MWRTRTVGLDGLRRECRAGLIRTLLNDDRPKTSAAKSTLLLLPKRTTLRSCPLFLCSRPFRRAFCRQEFEPLISSVMKEIKNSNCSGQSVGHKSTSASAHASKTSAAKSQKKSSDTKASYSGSRSAASSSRAKSTSSKK